MAADILLYDANIVPVGKDQLQHLEITRDIASRINHIYPGTLILPEVKVDENVMLIPGTDGQKMSKSYNNIIDIFLSEKKLRKQIMGIKTDSIPIEKPKNPDRCNVYKIYKLLSSKEQSEKLKAKYIRGNFGYGEAKKELFNLVCKNSKMKEKNIITLLKTKKF